MNTWINDVHDGAKTITDAASQLDGLASAFHRIGNSVVADELEVIADNIRLAQNKMTAAIGQDLSNQLQQSQAAIGQTLVAMLNASDRKSST